MCILMENKLCGEMARHDTSAHAMALLRNTAATSRCSDPPPLLRWSWNSIDKKLSTASKCSNPVRKEFREVSRLPQNMNRLIAIRNILPREVDRGHTPGSALFPVKDMQLSLFVWFKLLHGYRCSVKLGSAFDTVYKFNLRGLFSLMCGIYIRFSLQYTKLLPSSFLSMPNL